MNFRQPENAIPESNKSTPLQDGKTHIWTFRILKMHFLWISKSKFFPVSTANIWTLRSQNTRFLCTSFTDPLQDGTARILRFAADRHSRYLNVSQPGNVFLIIKTLTPFASQHLTILQSENAIPEHKKFLPFQERTAYFWMFRTGNMRFLTIRKSTPLL